DYDVIESNPVRCPDMDAAEKMKEAIMAAKERGDSVGGITQLEIKGLPAGLGDPVFGKIEAVLARAMISIGAVKGIEFGRGFEIARLNGSQNNDPMQDGDFLSNNAGGTLGGISTGQDLVCRMVVKPTASVSVEQKTIDIYGKNTNLVVEGRHDPCIIPRVIPVMESMAALVILDLWEIQERLRPGWNQ
ncbi:MAG: chorismate synthase, partial [Armatimonadota bacterium]